MKSDIREKIETEVGAWEYYAALPPSLHGYALDKSFDEHDDVLEIFRYEDKRAHRRAIAYFHAETMEYKLKVGFALTEFCLIDFIAAALEDFEARLRQSLDTVMARLSGEQPMTIDSLTQDKHIAEYDFGALLPASIAGFELYIGPTAIVPITNFSYIIIDYENFSNDSSLIIYYNVFRDEFFGEARIAKIPAINYQFDAATLDGLAEKLRLYLAPRLEEINRLAASELAQNAD